MMFLFGQTAVACLAEYWIGEFTFLSQSSRFPFIGNTKQMAEQEK